MPLSPPPFFLYATCFLRRPGVAAGRMASYFVGKVNFEWKFRLQDRSM